MGFFFLRAQTLILIRLSFYVILAYFLLIAPEKYYANPFVLAISTGLSPDTGTGSEGWISVLLICQAVDDLMRLTGPQMLHSFMHILPLRLLVLLVASSLCYLVKWGPLANSPTFAFLFYDCILTGFTFAAVREELNEDSKSRVRESRGFVSDAN